jgi:hypothetical protein
VPIANGVTFACPALSAGSARQAALLARSLRRFGGTLAASDFLALVPAGRRSIDEAASGALAAAGAGRVPFELPEEAARFPFGALAYAAAAAEEQLEGRSAVLAWLNPDTLVLAEPEEFRLAPGKVLAYRPVHHLLIGSPYDEPLDPFWRLAYERCGVASSAVFPMVTCADARRVRPYFNAGLLVVRPEARILRCWRDAFASHYDAPELSTFCERDERYRIFAHQVLLSASVLAVADKMALHELPDRYNYPLHLHESYESARRPTSVGELITCRYESLSDWPWRETIDVPEPYASWLAAEHAAIGTA